MIMYFCRKLYITYNIFKIAINISTESSTLQVKLKRGELRGLTRVYPTCKCGTWTPTSSRSQTLSAAQCVPIVPTQWKFFVHLSEWPSLTRLFFCFNWLIIQVHCWLSTVFVSRTERSQHPMGCQLLSTPWLHLQDRLTYLGRNLHIVV